ncbi:hypothetical protein Scep_012926 [Stephania cephalantha]|uniref:Uncharacterized protein n=1 Tax=Stephania cephalantha TaxID=152367 RepID=A0AAP0JHV1_9MAGN
MAEPLGHHGNNKFTTKSTTTHLDPDVSTLSSHSWLLLLLLLSVYSSSSRPLNCE